MFAAIDFFGDAKNLAPPVDMLDWRSSACQLSVELPRFISQRLTLTLLDGRVAVSVAFGDSLITAIGQFLDCRRNGQTAFFENSIIMNSPFTADD